MNNNFGDYLDTLEIETQEFSKNEFNTTLRIINKKAFSGHENKKSGRKSTVFAIAGLAVAACALFVVFALPQLLKTTVEPNNGIAIASPNPNPTHDIASPTPYVMPDAYSQKLCSIAVQVDDWIYYTNAEDNYRLYKIKENGTGKTKLSSIGTRDIQVVGDWIYFVTDYVQNPDNNLITEGYAGIYKISVNGGEEICLFKRTISYTGLDDGTIFIAKTIPRMIVNNNKIYFIEDSTPVTDGSQNSYIAYKMDIDGNNRTEITRVGGVLDFDAVDGYIYYNDNNDSRTYKIRDDGTEKTRFLDEELCNFKISDGWMYYTGTTFYHKITGEVVDSRDYMGESIDAYSESGFYKIRLDGTEKSKIREDYVDFEGRMNLEDRMGHGGSVGFFVIRKDWIYYEYGISDYEGITDDGGIYGYYSRHYLCKMKTDGHEDQVFLDFDDKIHIGIEGIIGEWVYFRYSSEENLGKLYKVKIDGTERQEVTLFGEVPLKEQLTEEALQF